MNNPKIKVEPDILFYAFRYALGRRTYAVNDVVSEIISTVKHIPDKDLICMSNEIMHYINDNNLSDSYKYLLNDWKHAYDCINKELVRRSKLQHE
jgi:hypothetical protein